MTKHVELVEDDVLLARHVAELLEEANYTVHHSRHALEAIASIDSQSPDVLLLDVVLPVASGFSLLHELQSYSDTASIPVVLYTSAIDGLRLSDLKEYGVRIIVDKTTMKPSDLVRAVHEALA